MTKEKTFFNKLQELLKKSYSPYSKFQVSAIAVDNNDNEYEGVNVENASFPCTVCAETLALSASVLRGSKPGTFKEIHILSSSDNYISPCGLCRQVMSEFMHDDAKIYQYSQNGDYRLETLSEILKHPVRRDDVKSK
ncbi:cytidine deaminase [Mycoplasmopsis synoviae]|uniref:Cytidine deaminase n=1 Tax=Mycoplasmopsis synoviae TaxID=2109 RepID=A0AAX3F1M1_MYCSY|nr:cytidine deaminase [Mycoplasmopsis synoviae]QGL44977.1 cytidine deaminase [Mycoplasmopsis synoviae]ULL02159.1 cytidine deaminase [Mycoplasmopsis synoviae]UZW64160.1 cytidine deaminase [Mycoplasmopsis synoviae]